MATILAIRGLLSGFKTYLVIGLWFACLATEKVLGYDIAGFDPGVDWMQQAFNYVLIATGRSALGKVSIGDTLQGILAKAKI